MAAPSIRNVDPAIVTRMEKIAAKTRGDPQALFGIGSNTWRKIRGGEPIRLSVADRLEQKVLQAAKIEPAK